MRSKEWRANGFSVTGGTMVWILYAPEDGTQVRCVNGWIPWQMEWDLPADTDDGQIRVKTALRFVDARSVSPRKIMVRSGISFLGEALVSTQSASWQAQEKPEDIQLLEQVYPVRLAAEVGEKTFQLDEELMLPQSCPAPGKLLAYGLYPEITESRILGSRLLFRGNIRLHVVYSGEDGQVFSWDFPVSISQYTELDRELGGDAQGSIWMIPTDLTLDLDETGHFRLKCGLVAQYEVDDVYMLPVTEDAYSLFGNLELNREEQLLQPVLEKRMLPMLMDQVLPQEADSVADISLLTDFPRLRKQGDQVMVEQPGLIQVLYYNGEGSLQSANLRWEGKMEIPVHPEGILRVCPASVDDLESLVTSDGIRIRGQIPLEVKTTAMQNFAPITQIRMGERKEPDSNRPSLILCRAGEKSLWELARECGSTVQAVRSASGLEGDPQPNRMLLIPVL